MIKHYSTQKTVEFEIIFWERWKIYWEFMKFNFDNHMFPLSIVITFCRYGFRATSTKNNGL